MAGPAVAVMQRTLVSGARRPGCATPPVPYGAKWPSTARSKASADEADMRQRKLNRAVVRRVLGYVRPYRRQLIGFVAAVIAGAVGNGHPATALPQPHRRRGARQEPCARRHAGRCRDRPRLRERAALAGATLVLRPDRRRTHLRPPGHHVRPRPADAAGVLHPQRRRVPCKRGSTTTSSVRSKRSRARSAQSSRMSSALRSR